MRFFFFCGFITLHHQSFVFQLKVPWCGLVLPTASAKHMDKEKLQLINLILHATENDRRRTAAHEVLVFWFKDKLLYDEDHENQVID